MPKSSRQHKQPLPIYFQRGASQARGTRNGTEKGGTGTLPRSRATSFTLDARAANARQPRRIFFFLFVVKSSRFCIETPDRVRNVRRNDSDFVDRKRPRLTAEFFLTRRV